MKIIIQKFGGTSVRDEEGRMLAIKHIRREISNGYKVVVVVSAMGRKGDHYSTDTLLSLIGSGDTKVSNREQDMLMSCGETISAVVFTNALLENGVSASAMNGGQAGFRTTSDFRNAKIIDMKMERLLEELNSVDVVVVTGFQGINGIGDVTTIGRGGSDTSASALGVALQADFIDIFTDVDGIMTADPRISPLARPLSTISYTEVCNLAHQGAKVLHPRAVEIAMQANIPIRIRSTYLETEGTLVTTKEKLKGLELKDRLVTSIAHLSNISQIKIHGVDGQFNLQSEVFNSMAKAEINVDFINIFPNGVHYTVSNQVVDRAEALLRDLGYEPQIERNCAKVSVVGAGISGVPGVTARIVTPLSEKNIQILQSADSHTTIWILVKEKDMVDAVNILHDVFNLHLEEELTE
ncbi:MAG: dapG [Bacillales bacterium]|nr:dapG [Bacillales bacterium]